MIVTSVMIISHRKRWKYANIMFKIKAIVKKMIHARIYMVNSPANSFIPVKKFVYKVNDVNFLMIQLQMMIFVLHLTE